MQHYTNRLRWAVLPVAVRVVGVVTLCVATLSFLAFHSTPRANATGLSGMITGTISSSPYSGPAGTTISVSGSGWGGTDGTPVSFGYEVNTGNNISCQIVSDSQNGTLNNGSFSGWFRWPSGTALNTFRVCAILGNAMEVAGSFSVLSSSPPAVSISPSTLAPNTHATITASNYYPSGTPVNFLWMSGNTVIENLNSSTSNTSGVAILTFSVPKLSIGSGSYSIDASAGGGQPAALFSSTNFTYTAPVVSPSPTPQPSPTPSPTMTPSPTTTPTVTPTATASVTATGASPTAGASPTLGNNQTPTTNSTNSGNSGGNNTGTPASGSSNSALLVGGVTILFGALLAGIVILLLLSRRRKASRAGAKVMPPRLPGNLNPASYPAYPSYNPVAGPGMFVPQPANMPAMPVTPAPVLVGAGAFVGNGNAVAPVANPGRGSMPPMPAPAPAQPPAWLTNPSSNENAPRTMSVPADSALDAIRRQAQSGLFVSPRPFKDESTFE
jgi:hypothetical protein